MVNRAEVIQELKDLRRELVDVMNNKKEVVLMLALANYNSDIKYVTKGNMQLVCELLSIELNGMLRCGCAYADEFDLVESTLCDLESGYFNNEIEEVQKVVNAMDDIRAKCMDYDDMLNHVEYYSNEEKKISDEIYELEYSLGLL